MTAQLERPGEGSPVATSTLLAARLRGMLRTASARLVRRPNRPHAHPRLGWLPTPRVVVAGRPVPGWVVLLAVYLAARIVSTAVLLIVWALGNDGGAASVLAGTTYLPAAYRPGDDFVGFLSGWDVQWYASIALQGYPTTLPVDAAGDVVPNAWAFFPLFPWTVRGVMTLVGAPVTLAGFTVVGSIVSTVFGALATLALHRMLRQAFTPERALWGAILFAVGPMSFLLQQAYAESFFLFFLFAALAAMVSRHYWVMIPFGLLASFSHPGALALAAALGMQGIARLWHRQPIRWHEWITAGLAIAAIGLAALAWPLISAHVTGDPSAYFDTESSWWRQFIPRLVFVPFTPFFLMFLAVFGIPGLIGTAIVLAATAVGMLRPRTRAAYGVDTWTYAASYLLYLVAVFFPTQSLFRMLLPLGPMLGHPALTGTRRARTIVIAASLALTPVCIALLWLTFPP